MKTYRFTETGLKHRLHRQDNQDACFVEAHGDYAFSFMADGMSSARSGDEAANIAVESARDIMYRTFLPLVDRADESGADVMRVAFAAAYNAIQRAACSEEDLNELLTTFMGVFLDERTGRLSYGYCGDGGIIALGIDGRARLLVVPQKGETHSQTTTLLDYHAWKFGHAEEVCACAVLTDGLFDALCPDGSLPTDDVRREVLARLLCVPHMISEPQMTSYLDDAFSLDRPSDSFGALFDEVTDDRSIVVISTNAVERIGAAHGAAQQGAAEDALRDEASQDEARYAPTPQELSTLKTCEFAAAPASASSASPAAPHGAPLEPAAETTFACGDEVAPLSSDEIVRLRTLLTRCEACPHMKREARRSVNKRRKGERHASAR